MAEPTSTAATTAAAAVVAPAITLFGVATGLSPAVLLAGVVGSLIALGLLGTVPSSGDTAKALIRTTIRRATVVVSSGLLAGYTTPAIASAAGWQEPSYMLGAACIIGAGAQKILPAAIELVTRGLNRTGGAQQ